MISLIIPHYNSCEKLSRLLKSIKTRHCIQVIVVDDSSDSLNNPLSLKEKFPSVDFIKNTHAKGAGGARNTGLEHVVHDWILFADSDDYFVNDGIDKIISQIDKDVDCVFYKSSSIFEENNIESDRHVHYNKLIDDYILLENENIRYKFYAPWSKLVKAQLVIDNKISFHEVIAGNDMLFSLLVGLKAKKIKACNDIVYCVTRSENSLTSNQSAFNKLARLRSAIKFNNTVIDNSLSFEYLRPTLGTFVKCIYLGIIFKYPKTFSSYLNMLIKRLKATKNES